VFLLQPSAVPATGGTTRTAPPDTLGSPVSGGGTTTSPTASGITEPPAGGQATTPPGTAADIFGGTPASRGPRTHLHNPPTSPLNLIGKLESWGIGPATYVADVSITLTAATGAQLKELLRKLPDGMTFALGLEKEDK
jgi:hypothetical protein